MSRRRVTAVAFGAVLRPDFDRTIIGRIIRRCSAVLKGCCSQRFCRIFRFQHAAAAPFRRHCYPFAVVTCGRHVATVGYRNPGLALARGVRTELARYRRVHGHAPRLLLLANHGVVALARTAPEALNISLMAEKWAQLLDGTHQWDGPAHLPAHAFQHLNG